jgi:hypothetical protein
MGGDEAALQQIAALNEALTLAVSLLRVTVGAVRSKRTAVACLKANGMAITGTAAGRTK